MWQRLFSCGSPAPPDAREQITCAFVYRSILPRFTINMEKKRPENGPPRKEETLAAGRSKILFGGGVLKPIFHPRSVGCCIISANYFDNIFSNLSSNSRCLSVCNGAAEKYLFSENGTFSTLSKLKLIGLFAFA